MILVNSTNLLKNQRFAFQQILPALAKYAAVAYRVYYFLVQRDRSLNNQHHITFTVLLH